MTGIRELRLVGLRENGSYSEPADVVSEANALIAEGWEPYGPMQDTQGSGCYMIMARKAVQDSETGKASEAVRRLDALAHEYNAKARHSGSQAEAYIHSGMTSGVINAKAIIEEIFGLV